MNYPGYTLVRREDCPEQHGVLTVLNHDVSGATVLLVENEDTNKAFGIGFGTLEQVDSLSLITQVALGMAAEAAELSDGHMVRNVVLFSVLVYELVGPTLTKLALTAAGEIIPEGRTSARTANKPEVPVSLD